MNYPITVGEYLAVAGMHKLWKYLESKEDIGVISNILLERGDSYAEATRLDLEGVTIEMWKKVLRYEVAQLAQLTRTVYSKAEPDCVSIWVKARGHV